MILFFISEMTVKNLKKANNSKMERNVYIFVLYCYKEHSKKCGIQDQSPTTLTTSFNVKQLGLADMPVSNYTISNVATITPHRAFFGL